MNGEWKINPDGWYPYCSNCHYEPMKGMMSAFCPNCGANMDDKAKENAKVQDQRGENENGSIQ